MLGSEHEQEDDAETVFRDMILLTLGALFVVLAIMFPHLNPKAVASAVAAVGAEPPGNVMIEMRWPDGIDTDVDLWVEAPDDVPVGYSNKSGRYFSLLRDDLGLANDATQINYEVAYARGMPPGEYTVNVHLYRNRNGQPVPVKVVASVKAGPQDSTRQILAREVTLAREGEELTVFRFSLDAAGAVVAGSVGNLQKPLRTGAKS